MEFVKMYSYSMLLITTMFQMYSRPSSGCLKEHW